MRHHRTDSDELQDRKRRGMGGGADIEAGGEKIARVFTTDPVSP